MPSSNGDYKRDIVHGQKNDNTTNDVKHRHIFRHSPPLSHKQWNVVVGELHCRVCNGTTNVRPQRLVRNIPLCKVCLDGLVEGRIDVIKLVKPPKPVQPLDEQRTVNRQGAPRNSFPREVQIARWIQCSCGQKYKTQPFVTEFNCESQRCGKSIPHNHPPAFEQWVQHSKVFTAHVIADYSDRNPDSDSAITSRLADQWRHLIDKIERKRNK